MAPAQVLAYTFYFFLEDLSRRITVYITYIYMMRGPLSNLVYWTFGLNCLYAQKDIQTIKHMTCCLTDNFYYE